MLQNHLLRTIQKNKMNKINQSLLCEIYQSKCFLPVLFVCELFLRNTRFLAFHLKDDQNSMLFITFQYDIVYKLSM